MTDEFSKEEIDRMNLAWSEARRRNSEAAASEAARAPVPMADGPRKMVSLLSEMATPGVRTDPRIDFRSRPQYCARCSSLEAEYVKHDKNWLPAQAASYEKNGRVYWLANCEQCEEILFKERHAKRVSSCADPNEHGISDNERNKRAYELQKLSTERAHWLEAQANRRERYARMSGIAARAAEVDPRGRGPGEAALTSEGAAKMTQPRSPAAAPEAPAPDYAMLRAEPKESEHGRIRTGSLLPSSTRSEPSVLLSEWGQLAADLGNGSGLAKDERPKRGGRSGREDEYSGAEPRIVASGEGGQRLEMGSSEGRGEEGAPMFHGILSPSSGTEEKGLSFCAERSSDVRSSYEIEPAEPGEAFADWWEEQ